MKHCWVESVAYLNFADKLDEYLLPVIQLPVTHKM